MAIVLTILTVISAIIVLVALGFAGLWFWLGGIGCNSTPRKR